MKKVKLLTPVISGVSLAAIAPAIIAVGIGATNKQQNKSVNSSLKSSTNEDVRPMDIQITAPSLSAREFFKSTSTEINWLSGTSPSTVDKSVLTSIGNSAFAFSKLQKITIPSKVTTIDPMAFYHCDDLKEIDLSLIQNSLLDYKNPDASSAFTLGEYAFKDAGKGIDEDTGSFVFSQLDTTGVETPATSKEYNMQMAYIKALIVELGANNKWPIKTKTSTTNVYEDTNVKNKVVPVQYMTFESDGKISAIDTSKITSTSDYDTVIFPAFMTGFTDDGLTAWQKVKEAGIIKTVGFLSPSTSSNATGVTTIEQAWFQGWDTVEKIILPSSVTTIEEGAFSNCFKLNDLDMSNVSLTSLPYQLAENAGKDASVNLTVEFPEDLAEIKPDAFSGANIQTLTLPSGLSIINDNAFEDCLSLKKVTIPSNITIIGENAFAGCTNLETVVFDESSNSSMLATIENSAFDDCPKLKTVANSPTYTEGTFTLPSRLGKYGSTNESYKVGSSAFAFTGEKDVDTFKVMNFSNIPADRAVNITFDEGAFDGWPSRGQIVGADDWTDATWTTVLANLQAGGLANTWVKVAADTENMLNVTYDKGTKLAINPGSFAEEHAPNIEYSYTANITDWHEIGTGTELSLSDNYQTIYLRGTNPNGFNIPHQEGTGYQQFGVLQFTNSNSNKGVTISGNVMGLIDAGAGTAKTMPTAHCFDKLFFGSTGLQVINSGFLSTCKTLTESCYQAMFMGCTNLKSTPALPATTLAKECYLNMFRNSGITTMPTLSVTDLAESCYEGMFQGCTSLQTVVDLPTTPTLAVSCFKNMFNGCSTMTTAPKLPETDDKTEEEEQTPVSQLKKSCYEGMFSGCNALTIAPTLSAKIIPEAAYKNMFTDCFSLKTTPTIYAPSDSSKYSFGVDCYKEMFKGCTGLNKMEVKFTEWPMDGQETPVQATSCWVEGLTPGGKFRCPQALPHGDDTYWNKNQIPVGWEVEETDKPIDPYNSEETNTEMGITCKEDTNITLLNYGTNSYETSKTGCTRPDLRVKFVDENGETTMDWTSIYDGDESGKFDKKGSPRTFTLPAGHYAFFKGYNADGWSHEGSDATGWTDNYSSLWFSRPSAYVKGYTTSNNKKFENYIDRNTGEAPTSTGVSLFGNIMSLVLNGVDPTTGDDIYKPEDEEFSSWCFASLFRGRTKLSDDNVDDATESAQCNYYQHNYCIEEVSNTFLSVPSLTKAIFAKTFAVCPNLTAGANVWSRMTAGQRSTKWKAFGDTYQGCAGLVTPPDYNLDCIDSADDGYEAFHGTLIDCWKLTETPHIKIKDISMLETNSSTWGYAYYQDYMLSTMYCYVDMTEAQLESYSGQKQSNIFYAWAAGNIGKNVDSSVEKKIFMAPNFYTWLCKNLNKTVTTTTENIDWYDGHPTYTGHGKDKKYEDPVDGTNCDITYTTTTTITWYAFVCGGDTTERGQGPQASSTTYYSGQLPAGKDNRWKVYNIYNQSEELVWTGEELLYI